MSFPFLEVVVGSMIWTYVFESYLVLRQLLALKLPTLPKSLEGLISQENFEKSRAYYIDRSNLRFVYQSVNILMDSTILWFKVLPWFWKKSGHFVALIGLNEENEILHTLPYLAGLLVWLEVGLLVLIAYKIPGRIRRGRHLMIQKDLSFSFYYIFVIEARHGFNKQTIWLFSSGKIIRFCRTVIHAVAIVPAAILIVKTLEFSGWSSIYSIISLWVLMMMIYPIRRALLCQKFSRLPKGPLREKIETLTSSLKFPLKKLLVVNHSRWSNHSNAYMGGILNCKRIVLCDTVIQQFESYEEIVALVAHELGHWKHNHVVYWIIGNQICTVLYIGGYILVRNWSSLFQSFGFHTRPLIIGFIILQYATTPIQKLVYLMRRACEYQADAFAKKLGYASSFRACLLRLHEGNLLAVNMDPWYSAYHNTHPTLVERLDAIGKPDEEECSA